MLAKSPFDARTAPLNTSHEWRDWAGVRAAAAYGLSLDAEYFAVRDRVGLIDVSPLYKYDLVGGEAELVLDRMVTRDLSRLAVGRVTYGPWCDDAGMVVDDGTVHRLGPNHWRLTAAEPQLSWLQDCAHGFEVDIQDRSSELAALAVAGPRARQLMVAAAGSEIGRLPYFGVQAAAIDAVPVEISRTGYTGDLGYEVWLPAAAADRVWDRLLAVGHEHGVAAVGLAALDVLRLEASYLLLGVDYLSARSARTAADTSTPYELDLSFAVAAGKARYFIGRGALAAARPLRSRLVGVEVDWVELERHYADFDLPPALTGRVTRARQPLMVGSRQVGYLTSAGFSPLLKRYLGLGHVFDQSLEVGSLVAVDLPIEQERRRVRGRIVRRPFLDLERRRRP